MSDPTPAYFPPIEPYDSGLLAVGDPHRIHYEQSGNPDGQPVVVLHGGPGAAPGPKVRQFFDPARFRIVVFHQRGCGRSVPHACLEDNTTPHLVDDVERLREHLAIERWLVFGGSWGSTLALAYAQAHPRAVTGLVLRGIFLGRRWEIEWLYQNPLGTGALFPEEWSRFQALIPAGERHDMIAAYHRRLVSDEAGVRDPAAQHWARWEGAASHLVTSADEIDRFVDPVFAAAVARIECHYFKHDLFLRPNQLLDEMKTVRDHAIPGAIVHGRYDALCPPATAWALHLAWPEATFEYAPAAGHSMFEPPVAERLLKAIAAMPPRTATETASASVNSGASRNATSPTSPD